MLYIYIISLIDVFTFTPAITFAKNCSLSPFLQLLSMWRSVEASRCMVW